MSRDRDNSAIIIEIRQHLRDVQTLVRKLALAKGIARKTRTLVRDRITPDDVAARLRAGESRGQIARSLGVGLSVVSSLAVQAGLKGSFCVKTGFPTKVHSHSAVMERLAQGETLKAVAATFGVSRERIRQIALKHGRTREDVERVCALRKAAREMREKGLSFPLIAAALGVSAAQARRLAKELQQA
jgi:uncharacterized protein (DUF433 family)